MAESRRSWWLAGQLGESSRMGAGELYRESDQSKPLRKGPNIKYIGIKPGEMENWEKTR